MTTGNLREYLRGDGLKAGTSIFEFDTPGIGHILKAAGAEYAFIDMEHSGFGIDAVKRLLRYCEAADLYGFVRPPSKETHHIGRVLDAGADGLILPMVGSADEARRIIDAMKYVPDGHRGVALGIAHDRYAPGPTAQKLARANDRTAFIALIETAEGLADVDAIAALDDLDALWVGHFDLSCSLGIPGQFDHPDFTAAMDRVVEAGHRHGKALGRLVATPAEGTALYRQGFDAICYSGDLWLMQAALADGLAAMRAEIG
jgi:2-keto-3-deoxy-L-rhamnonate aldolase RhmA